MSATPGSFSLVDLQEVELLSVLVVVAAMDCSGPTPVLSNSVAPSGPVRRKKSFTLGGLLKEDIV